MIKVFIDAGHGGVDSGAVGRHIGLLEKDYTLKIALEVTKLLEQQNIQVISARTTDKYVSLLERTNMANAAKADIYVSIHHNSFSDVAANGAETFAHATKNPALARAIQNEIKGLFKIDRGVKTYNFHVLRESKMPSALVELGFISNKAEEIQIRDEWKAMANAVAKGIFNYLGIKPVKPKPTPKPDPKPTGKNVAKIKPGSRYKSKDTKFNNKVVPKRYIDVYMEYKLNQVKGEDWIHFPKIDSYVAAKDVIVLDAVAKPTPKPKPKEKWLRIPTNITTYKYYDPYQSIKTTAYAKGTLRPINYAKDAKFIEYKVIAEKGNFKTIQLHGNPKNPKIDIYTGPGTEHAWEIFYK